MAGTNKKALTTSKVLSVPSDFPGEDVVLSMATIVIA